MRAGRRQSALPHYLPDLTAVLAPHSPRAPGGRSQGTPRGVLQRCDRPWRQRPEGSRDRRISIAGVMTQVRDSRLIRTGQAPQRQSVAGFWATSQYRDAGIAPMRCGTRATAASQLRLFAPSPTGSDRSALEQCSSTERNHVNTAGINHTERRWRQANIVLHVIKPAGTRPVRRQSGAV